MTLPPHAIVHLDPDPGWRGGQQLVHRLARQMHSLGDPVGVACVPGAPLHQALVRDGVPTLAVGPGRDVRTPLRLRRVAPRLVVAHSSHAHTLGLCSGLDLVVHRWVDARPNLGWKYRRVRRFVACSQAVARVLEDSGVPPERICVVYGGVDVSAYLQPPPPALDAPDVLAVGARVPHKGHDVLARAAALLPGVDIAVAGEGPLSPAGLRWLGARSDVGALLAGARVFVQPSRSEGLGMAVVEAMLMGVPVVASRVGGIPEIVGDDGILVPPGDAEALAAGIQAALSGALAGRLARAQQRVAAQFSTAAMVDGSRGAYGLPR